MTLTREEKDLLGQLREQRDQAKDAVTRLEAAISAFAPPRKRRRRRKAQPGPAAAAQPDQDGHGPGWVPGGEQPQDSDDRPGAKQGAAQ